MRPVAHRTSQTGGEPVSSPRVSTGRTIKWMATASDLWAQGQLPPGRSTITVDQFRPERSWMRSEVFDASFAAKGRYDQDLRRVRACGFQPQSSASSTASERRTEHCPARRHPRAAAPRPAG